jgi:para-nitrobenzyl esterase
MIHAPAMADARAVQISTRSGALCGKRAPTVMRFLGIPYAQPPIDGLRFMPPKACAPWSGVRDAFEFQPAAMQLDAGPSPHLPVAPACSEDCLYLNVWAPMAPGPHPVYVFIHGGGNVEGTAAMPVLDGEKLARKGIVVVTIAYRLGAFGFLDLSALLGDAYAGSGNNGLRDQALALAWVRGNIAAFGGDPDMITIGGQSAGAKNVVSLLAMPDTRGLYHRAVCQSGGGHAYASLDMAHDVAERMLRQVGMERAQARTLTSLPAMVLLAAQAALIADYPLRYPFRAVVDRLVLPLPPVQAIGRGAAADIPLLLGTTRDEQVAFGPATNADGSIQARAMCNVDFSTFSRILASYPSALPALDEADRRYRALGAESYWMPTIRVAEAQRMAGGACYLYRFDMPAVEGDYRGHAVHGAELAFVFDNLDKPSAAAMGPVDADARRLGRLMSDYWTSFIKHGRPHTQGAPAWMPYELDARAAMVFERDSHSESDPDGIERRLWADWEPICR